LNGDVRTSRLILAAVSVIALCGVPQKAQAAETPPDKPIGALEWASERDPFFGDNWAYEGWMWDPTGKAAFIFISVDGVYVSDWASKQSVERPDVAATHPGAPNDTGFRIGGINGHAPATACALAADADGNVISTLGCLDVPATAPNSPVGALDVVDGPGDGSFTVKGWAADPDASGPRTVDLTVDGNYWATFSTGVARPDVQAAYPFAGPDAGYEHTEQRRIRGAHRMCVYAINDGREGRTVSFCADVVLPDPRAPLPLGAFDTISETAGTFRVWGWMFDPVTPFPGLHIEVNGVRDSATSIVQIDRPDVVAAYPQAPPNSGFMMNIDRPAAGQVCVVAQNFYGDETTLGCKELPPSFDGSPTGVLDDAVPEAGRVVLRGWAVEPDPGPPLEYVDEDTRAPEPSTIHVYMDGQFLLTHIVDQARPDVQTAIPQAGPDDGFQIVVPARPGAHDLCVYAINRGPTGRNVTLGCRHLDVPQSTGAAPPFGFVDAEVAQPLPPPLIAENRGFAGWAAATSGATATVRVVAVGGFYGNGEGAYDVTGPTGLDRPDVQTVFPGTRGDTGYLVMAGGGHFFHYRLACVSARDPNTGSEAVLGCAAYNFSSDF
jgi:hypothetical protein